MNRLLENPPLVIDRITLSTLLTLSSGEPMSLILRKKTEPPRMKMTAPFVVEGCFSYCFVGVWMKSKYRWSSSDFRAHIHRTEYDPNWSDPILDNATQAYLTQSHQNVFVLLELCGLSKWPLHIPMQMINTTSQSFPKRLKYFFRYNV